MSAHAPPPPLDPADPELDPAAIEAEARRKSRKRWLTLAEILGIVGLAIAGLTLWNNISMRQGQEAERAAEQQRESDTEAVADRESRIVTLQGTPQKDGRQLSLEDLGDHRIQSVQIRFPPSLGVATRESLLDLTLDSGWMEKPLLAATDGGPDRIEGRLPVLITSSYWQGDQPVSDAAIYDLVFRTEGAFLTGRSLKLRGLVLVDRVKPGSNVAALDKRWAAERKRIDALKE